MKENSFGGLIKMAIVDRLQLLNNELAKHNEVAWTYWCLALRALIYFLLELLVGSQKIKENESHFRKSMKELSLADLTVLETIGVGGYAQVHLVRSRKDRREYALKVIQKERVTRNKQERQICSEKNVLIRCQNEFIVRLYKTFRDADHLYLLMECCRGGELWSLIHDWGRLDENSAKYYCAAVIEALDYLHQRAIVYRDLKPENVLIELDGTPKLVDFGFAKQLQKDDMRTWTFCGTTEYLAPELVLNQGHDWGVDIWAVGIFLYEMLAGTPPFTGSNPEVICCGILQGIDQVCWPKYFSSEAISLISRLCKPVANERLGYNSGEEIRQNIWFTTFDFISFRKRFMKAPYTPKQVNRCRYGDGKPLVTSNSSNRLNNWDWDATFDHT